MADDRESHIDIAHPHCLLDVGHIGEADKTAWGFVILLLSHVHWRIVIVENSVSHSRKCRLVQRRPSR